MSDSRFERLRTDPRFRPPKKKQQKVVVDKRFKSLFTLKKKRKSGVSVIPRSRVDKYGRPLSETHDEDNLKRFYRLEDDPLRPGPDYARGELLLESSDEEGEKNDDRGEESDGSSQNDGTITIGGDAKTSRVSEDEGLEVDLDENDFADLDAQALAYGRAHPMDEVQDGKEEVQRTTRLAAVNFDWDHVRAIHLYKICSSLVSPTGPLASSLGTVDKKGRSKGSGNAHNVVKGQVLSVRIYPSEFGKERMVREDREGPPAEIFKKRENESDGFDEKNIHDIGDEMDYDEETLRKYQLERLRYYYAIITCDTVDAAVHIYSELDGTELERSANVFDLSFVPDNMVFDDECRDEATEHDLNPNYKALEFVTDALRHSKVKLTWDDDNPERNQVTRRKFTWKEIEEADFHAFLASSSSDSDLEESRDIGQKKQNQKELGRDRLRALLFGGGNDQVPEGWAKDRGVSDDVDMEITFTPGLSEKKNEEHETTLEKYQKKVREKRKKRKEDRKTAHEGITAEDDDFFAADSGNGTPEELEEEEEKRQKNGKRNPVKNTPSKTAVSAEELALLVADDNPNSEPKHFNFKSAIKAEKRTKRKKGKKRSELDDENERQEDFVINVRDERFKALHEDPNFAIDPTNPRFKKTKSMAALLEERQRRQSEIRSDAEGGAPKPAAGQVQGLQSLVESVKRKSARVEHRSGKRRKL
ncbi:hypothetical protein AX15_001810 [Amanita polypyramis BW_CC]|nr:hypothetical protein AX15_001810 [Amanita polypyramis BW_CC]